jgi:ribonuclease HIII
MSLSSYTTPIQSADVKKIRVILEEGGFEFKSKPYAYFSAKKGKLNVTVYEKGPKVLIQGKETEDFVRFTLEPMILGEAKLGYEEVNEPEMFEPHFGVDESGKGDFFISKLCLTKNHRFQSKTHKVLCLLALYKNFGTFLIDCNIELSLLG